MWRQLPNAISSARLLATPVLLYAAIARDSGLFKWLLLACLLSDIADGLVARALDLRSQLGARLDSMADMIVFTIGIFGLYAFQAEVLVRHWVPLAAVVGLYLIEVAGALWRYGRISSFHTILVRISAYAQGIFVMSLFLFGYVAWVFYPMIVLTVLAYSEELGLLFLLPEWTADVRGIYWVLARRRV
jgi:phosphatidylglycerophosphate synthase